MERPAPTTHAAERLIERFYPNLTEKEAFERLRRLACTAKPLKVNVRRGGRK